MDQIVKARNLPIYWFYIVEFSQLQIMNNCLKMLCRIYAISFCPIQDPFLKTIFTLCWKGADRWGEETQNECNTTGNLNYDLLSTGRTFGQLINAAILYFYCPFLNHLSDMLTFILLNKLSELILNMPKLIAINK